MLGPSGGVLENPQHADRAPTSGQGQPQEKSGLQTAGADTQEGRRGSAREKGARLESPRFFPSRAPRRSSVAWAWLKSLAHTPRKAGVACTRLWGKRAP